MTAADIKSYLPIGQSPDISPSIIETYILLAYALLSTDNPQPCAENLPSQALSSNLGASFSEHTEDNEKLEKILAVVLAATSKQIPAPANVKALCLTPQNLINYEKNLVKQAYFGFFIAYNWWLPTTSLSITRILFKKPPT